MYLPDVGLLEHKTRCVETQGVGPNKNPARLTAHELETLRIQRQQEKEARKERNAEKAPRYKITDEKLENECKEIDDATKEAGKRNKKDRELTYEELYPIVAQRIFDAQWEAYRNDRTIDTVYHQKKRPRFRNLEQFEKALNEDIDYWRSPDHPGDANYNEKK